MGVPSGLLAEVSCGCFRFCILVCTVSPSHGYFVTSRTVQWLCLPCRTTKGPARRPIRREATLLVCSVALHQLTAVLEVRGTSDEDNRIRPTNWRQMPNHRLSFQFHSGQSWALPCSREKLVPLPTNIGGNLLGRPGRDWLSRKQRDQDVIVDAQYACS